MAKKPKVVEKKEDKKMMKKMLKKAGKVEELELKISKMESKLGKRFSTDSGAKLLLLKKKHKQASQKLSDAGGSRSGLSMMQTAVTAAPAVRVAFADGGGIANGFAAQVASTASTSGASAG